MNTAHSTIQAAPSSARNAGSTGSTTAPAASSRLAAASTAATISGSTAQHPSVVDRPSRIPVRSPSRGCDEVERAGHRHDVGVVGALRGGQEQAGVVGAAGQRPVVADRVEQAGQHVHRDPPEPRLQPDDAAPRRRDAHRAAHVAALGERHAPGRDGGAAAAGRAARRAVEGVRVARRAPQRAVGDERVGELGRRRLADDDRRPPAAAPSPRRRRARPPRARRRTTRASCGAPPPAWCPSPRPARRAARRAVRRGRPRPPLARASAARLVVPDRREAVERRLHLVRRARAPGPRRRPATARRRRSPPPARGRSPRRDPRGRSCTRTVQSPVPWGA